MKVVLIPIVTKGCIYNFVKIQILNILDVGYLDDNEVLTPTSYSFHIDKKIFRILFVCDIKNLGDALRKINEILQYSI